MNENMLHNNDTHVVASSFGDGDSNSNSHQNVNDPNENNDDMNVTLSERFYRIIEEVEKNPDKAVKELKYIQEQVAHLSLLFSKNECYYVNEINTKSLLFIMVEHYLAISYVYVPTTPNEMIQRKHNLQLSCHLWIEFIRRIEQLEDDNNDNDSNDTSITLSKNEKKLYNELIEVTDSLFQQQSSTPTMMSPNIHNISRDEKISRYQRKKDVENELKKLRSYQDRRKRLNIIPTDEMDGYDEDELERIIIIRMIELCKVDCFNEWMNVLRELPMISQMVSMQQQHQQQASHRSIATSSSQQQQQTRSQNHGGGPPIQLTHITQNPFTGQVSIKKEEYKANVFRPSWNLPSMSLEELAEIEVRNALERDERQKQAEQLSKTQPKRYHDLCKDGNEDNVDLVDQSAYLDRRWDDWKDENPKGSGNKRGDVGDRNF